MSVEVILYSDLILAMDGSSTETDDPQHFEKAKPKKRTVRKDLPAKKRTKRNDADNKWKSFLERFAHRLATCQQAQRGCYFCSHDCFLKTEPLLDEIRRWRESFSEMSDAVADKEILWIYQNSRQGGFDEQLDQDHHHKQQQRHSKDDQQSSVSSTDTEEADCLSTSTSEPSDDVLELDCNPGKNQTVAIKPAKREYNPRVRTKKTIIKTGDLSQGCRSKHHDMPAIFVFLFGHGTRQITTSIPANTSKVLFFNSNGIFHLINLILNCCFF